MAVFTAMQASRLRTAQTLHTVRELLHNLKNETALRDGELIEVCEIEGRVTEVLAKLIPNSPAGR